MIDRFVAQRLIDRFLEEDLTWGDITTDLLIPAGIQGEGSFYAKEDGILAGIDVCDMVFKTINPDIYIKKYFSDGDKIKKYDIIAEIHGDANSILKGERLSLNLLQRMSGIATYTKMLADKINGTKAKITDTRKTMPGLRYFDKYAVCVGGGINHRYNLSDGVLIKDNHIKACKGIKNAIEYLRDKLSHTMKIEIEVETLDELEEALKYGVDIVLLDNMPIDMMARAVEIAGGKVLLEASGNVTEENILDIAKTGVDVISVGAITHSTKALDISLDF